MDFKSIFSLADIIEWAEGPGLRVAGILIAAWLTVFILKKVVVRVVRKFIDKGISELKERGMDKAPQQERIKTIEKVIVSILGTVIWLIAIITALPELGINIGPLLAGLGVGGLALGFGARSLIQDYISGLFILIEDQFRVGEQVEIAGAKGRVAAFNLRKTTLISEEGNLVHIPNSQIRNASNFSRR